MTFSACLSRYCATLGLIAALTTGSALADSTPAAAPEASETAPRRGYLHGAQIPDSLTLLPPPPAPGSIQAMLDDAVAAEAIALNGSARFQQARRDSEMGFPASANHFACAIGMAVDEAHTPTLYHLLKLAQHDAGGASTKAAKEYYQRPRPFMVNGQPVCTPEWDAALRGNGSYPSGHTATGWAMALILAELVPERATQILQRGRSYGHSRLVCNVHWYSDVQQGQMLGAATVAALHANVEFAHDLAIAKREIQTARTLHLPPPHDCAEESAALATSLEEAR